MSQDAIALWTETSSDPELIAGVRAGDGTAFGVLYERHKDAARKVAAQYTNSASDVDDVVAESFSRVLRALQRGDGPDLAFRAYLFTIVRRTGMEVINRGNRTRPGDDMGQYEAALGYEAPSDEGAMAGFEQGIVADAFRSLPERWQAVLWYTEVEKKSPKEIAPLLGLTANGVAALAYRAREALRQAYLQQHLSTAESMDCIAASTQLGAYVRGGLAKREHAKVDEHVQSCDKCAALVAELEDVNRGMRGIIAPLVLGVLGVGALEGGLPIGGAFAPPGSPTGTDGGASAAAGAGAAATAGAAGTGVAAWLASASSFALPAAAAVGIVALVVSGASYLGVFNPLGGSFGLTPTTEPTPGAAGDPTADPQPTASVEPSVEPSTEPSVEPSAEPNPGPAAAVDDGPSGASVGPSGGTPGGVPGGTPGGSSGQTPNPKPTSTSSPEPTDEPTTEPTDEPTTEPTAEPTDEPTTEPTDPPAPPKVASLSFGAAPLELLAISATDPQVTTSITNSGDGDAEDLTAQVTLPDGLTFATPAGGAASFSLAPASRIANYLSFGTSATFTAGDWTCTLDDAQTTASCDLDVLAAGDTGTLALELTPITNLTYLGDDAWTSFAAQAGDVSASYRVLTRIDDNDEDLKGVYAASGHVAATQVGATLMQCDPSTSACSGVMTNKGSSGSNLNNNNQKMIPLNEAGGKLNSASTALTEAFLPKGAKVKFALLEWSANRATADPNWTGATDAARLRVPGGEYQAITADSTEVSRIDGRFYYQSRKDITDLVAKAGRGDYALADIALTATLNDSDRTYYGGFSITVIYELDSLPSSRVALFAGSQWVSSASPADFAFYTSSAADVTLGWTAWEGDRGTSGDVAKLDGVNLTPLGWDGKSIFAASSGNAADSTAFGGKWANTLGVDAKAFQPRSPAPGLHRILVTSTGDNYLVGSLTVTVTTAD